MRSKARDLAAKRNFQAFIRDDPITIELQRRAKTATAGGGKQRGPRVGIGQFQTFRLVPAGTRHGQIAQTSGEEVEAASHVLVGPVGSNVQKGDEFQVGGQWYRVISVDTDAVDRVSAGCIEHGSP